MLEQAMAAGFLSMGMDVLLTGPLPTPAIASLTRSLRADVGVMISASHNHYKDNGIKLFAADGFKLPDEIEIEIEKWMDSVDLMMDLPLPEKVGRATRIEDALGRYVELVKSSFPRGQTLEGLKIVLDCANGAAYRAAPLTLWELEANVITIGDKPDGKNINHGCGATYTDLLQRCVLENGADIGIALDGDADRLIMIDEKGQKIDGDQLLAVLALNMKERNELPHHQVVATVMSNLGLERFLKQNGIELLRTAVGDRYVVEKMKETGAALGGEQSGHMILAQHATTGDGLMAALNVLSVLKQKNKPASQVLNMFKPVPQILKNIRFEKGAPLKDVSVQSAVEEAERTLLHEGRVLVRASGTEPVIRIMAEGDDQSKIEKVVAGLSSAIEQAAAKAS
jgi:phosphoglucosamine mutase